MSSRQEAEARQKSMGMQNVGASSNPQLILVERAKAYQVELGWGKQRGVEGGCDLVKFGWNVSAVKAAPSRRNPYELAIRIRSY
jgi:hypothetical protein